MELKPRFAVLVAVVAVTLMAITTATEAVSPDWKDFSIDGQLVGDRVSDEEEMMMESGWSHRSLVERRFISYDALKANQVPCGRRGRSYYDCNRRGNANPYRRGCTAITHCARQTD
ncbi:protein RALF-like 19 [Prosopis cineraria]|uniref:protein RALF-like 19 n=1 Tax=Prosopis cineraria TaxID=364024 RepID=UPI00240FF3C2|nr:protein RALF-like 19 [Prosopis cineraria]XP_054800640.1 protein RALF-like 19 [Prosopis cineraria]